MIDYLWSKTKATHRIILSVEMIYGACGTLICVTDAMQKKVKSNVYFHTKKEHKLVKGSICALGIGDGAVETFIAELADS